jgi:hypothetical protein
MVCVRQNDNRTGEGPRIRKVDMPRKPRNLASLAHIDTSAANGHWRSESYTKPDGRPRRAIYRYGTLMMELALDGDKPITHPHPFDAIVFEREGGSITDKCERLTPGCCVDHTVDGPWQEKCETW